MATGFDTDWAERSIAQLKERGVRFTDGLRPADFDEISVVFGAPVPEELQVFLSVGVPVSKSWAQWVEGPDRVAADARKWIDHGFAFDIENGQYWHPLFGDRPSAEPNAIEKALAFVASAPPLLPIYGHRFLTTTEAPRAVLSVWQATDSIFYGNDLADYFTNEFQIDRPTWAAAEAPPVPVWEDLFDLWGHWFED